MNDQQLQLLTQQLADIAMPPAPDWQPVYIAVALFVLFALTTAVMLYAKKKASPAKTTQTDNPQARLDALQHAWKKGEASDHDAAYQVAILLRQGLKLKQLNSTPPTLLAEEKDWREVIEQLDALRYRNTDNALDETIFAHTRRWLKSEAAQC